MDISPGHKSTPRTEEIATIAGGCFWCLEAVFSELKGVKRIVPGYSGGTLPNPTYEDICAGKTGHAEVVQVTFDPEALSYRQVMEVFFAMHDPTTLNRQGADIGPQYRSAVFYHSEEQRATAAEVIREIESAGAWRGPIVTEVTPLAAFYPAEDYHREYYQQHRTQPYCRLVIDPKMVRLRALKTGTESETPADR